LQFAKENVIGHPVVLILDSEIQPVKVLVKSVIEDAEEHEIISSE